MQIPPTTTLFSTFSFKLEQAIQQIVSPSKERQSIEGLDLGILSEVELHNLPNSEDPFENLGFLEDRGIQNLFPTPSLFLPIDASYPNIDDRFDGLPTIARPIEETLASPLNQSFLTNSLFSPRYLLNQLNRDQSQTETKIEPKELYLVEEIEQFQSPDFVLQLQNIQEDSHGHQIGNENLKIKEATTSLPLEISLLLIVISGSMEGNVIRREIYTFQ